MHGMEEAVTAGGLAHHQALEMLATQALAEGDAAKAFALADRRCRIRPAPEAHSFVLRAETHHRLGRIRFAIADLEAALAVAPEDVAANRRMLAWGKGEARARAARTLIRVDRDLASLMTALAFLESRGERTFATVQVFDATVRGWVAWHGDAAVAVTISGDLQNATTYIEPEPTHPLAAGPRHAATFEVARAPCAGPQTVAVSVGDATCLSVGAPPNARPESVTEPVTAPAPREAFDGVTVIVPVYADYAATRACLDRLVAELDAGGGAHRAVIVDDAAPDPRMAPYLRKLAANHAVTLLSNPRNLGFVGAVNRALATTASGDVILLNADTIPPPGFIGRLAAAARRDDDIGIVTALSNDAEMTSFPLPGRANPLASPEAALALDRIAAEANAGRMVDLPSGTGFCLYLTRRCLDAVGRLSATFHRGYMEDVELCLRARARGFRTVCDTSIFVGHAGSRSFGAEKAALALRNFTVLSAQHPGYADECRAFADADPLRPARAAIELAAAPRAGWRLLVAGDGTVGAIAQARASAAVTAGDDVLLLTLSAGRVFLANPTGAMPQSLAFDLAAPDGLARALDAYPPTLIEIVDAAAVPAPLLPLLAHRGVPLHLVVADGGPFSAALLDATHAIVAATAEAEAFARRTLPAAFVEKIKSAPPASAPRRVRRGSRDRLGLVLPTADPQARALVTRLALAIPEASLVVIGDVPDATGLLRHGNVAVTGTVAPAELATLARHLGIGRLFAERRTPLFGHPLVEAATATGLPLAYRDWSFGALPPARRGDLALAPDAAPDEVAAALARWMT
jgi:GT2 family glycosyltransferase